MRLRMAHVHLLSSIAVLRDGRSGRDRGRVGHCPIYRVGDVLVGGQQAVLHGEQARRSPGWTARSWRRCARRGCGRSSARSPVGRRSPCSDRPTREQPQHLDLARGEPGGPRHPAPERGARPRRARPRPRRRRAGRPATSARSSAAASSAAAPAGAGAARASTGRRRRRRGCAPAGRSRAPDRPARVAGAVEPLAVLHRDRAQRRQQRRLAAASARSGRAAGARAPTRPRRAGRGLSQMAFETPSRPNRAPARRGAAS